MVTNAASPPPPADVKQNRRRPPCPHLESRSLGRGWQDPERAGPTDPYGPRGTWQTPREWFRCTTCGKKWRRNRPPTDGTPPAHSLPGHPAPARHPWPLARRLANTWTLASTYRTGRGSRTRWALEREVLHGFTVHAEAWRACLRKGLRPSDLTCQLAGELPAPGQTFGRWYRGSLPQAGPGPGIGFYLPKAEAPAARAWLRAAWRVVRLIYRTLHAFLRSLGTSLGNPLPKPPKKRPSPGPTSLKTLLETGPDPPLRGRNLA